MSGRGDFQVVTERRRERAVVVANVVYKGDDPEDAMVEICELLDTAGVDTLGTLAQKRDKPHAKTYLGSGKLDELKRLAEHHDVDVVVVDDELQPSQQRVLEDVLEKRVLDRTAVILDIFALHAHTAEGKLQVELAQLEYNLTRMRGMWKHLERLGAGVGTRGPGESQLETDRRLARQRISFLRKKLGALSNRRQTMRQSRQESIVPKVALAGYTNAGKSTLLNTLTGATVSAKDRLFETLDPTTRSYDEGGRRYLITDTVGFIERLPHQLVDAFASTLEETLQADLIIIVADGSLPEERLAAHISAVRDVLEEIGAGEIPSVLALNKCDSWADGRAEQLVRRYPEAIVISAASDVGIDDLTVRVSQHFADRFIHVDLLVPYSEAGLLHELYSAGAPVTRRDEEDGIHASAHLPIRLMSRIEKYRVDTASPAGGDA